ncbi:FMN-dependent NADH-azoreductase [Chitinophaga sp. CF418]|uniref:FMN-dependent NADH-azoreductase n=1 Tax=Chitinophaga sp. CF418 TaxID=1855287 RepID=UPI00091319DC|nr:NAD(P)H-dependent oxidoreductase [Chitinophaga sp. CF418]SHL89251.1 FMN-dependent NADH-azoreductase [Chitinophaga sp. CF418]
MSKILVINASARTDRSFSRILAAIFVGKWKQKHPEDSVVHREVGQENIPHVSEAWIAGAFKPAHLRTEEDVAALGVSNILINELKEADIIVLSTPMYNWSIPSSLKAYIDQVLRVNETVLIEPGKPDPYTGLLKNKKAFLLLVRGNKGYEPGEYFEHMNFQTNYLKTVFRIMGIHDVEIVLMNGAAHGEETSSAALTAAREEIEELINR